MLFEEGLVAHLTATAAVTAFVGTAPARIHPNRLPQNIGYPAISYQKITRTHLQTHDGLSGLARPRIQINCWAEGNTQAQNLADAVRYALEGFRGNMGTVSVMGGFAENATDRYDDEAEKHGVSMDFFFFYQELVRAS